MTTIMLPNAVAESASGKYIPPVSDGLLYWQFLNASLDKIKHNFAPGQADHTLVGTITPEITMRNLKAWPITCRQKF